MGDVTNAAVQKIHFIDFYDDNGYLTGSAQIKDNDGVVTLPRNASFVRLRACEQSQN